MDSRTNTKILENVGINVRLKLAGIWTAVTLCYLYCEIVGFYQPGAIDGILSGKMGPLGSTTQELLLAVAIFMSTPCIMVFVSVFFKPIINRWLNVIFGIIHTVAMILTMFMGPWSFYLYFGVIEIIFTLLIVWFAWNWPKVQE